MVRDYHNFATKMLGKIAERLWKTYFISVSANRNLYRNENSAKLMTSCRSRAQIRVACPSSCYFEPKAMAQLHCNAKLNHD